MYVSTQSGDGAAGRESSDMGAKRGLPWADETALIITTNTVQQGGMLREVWQQEYAALQLIEAVSTASTLTRHIGDQRWSMLRMRGLEKEASRLSSERTEAAKIIQAIVQVCSSPDVCTWPCDQDHYVTTIDIVTLLSLSTIHDGIDAVHIFVRLLTPVMVIVPLFRFDFISGHSHCVTTIDIVTLL